MFKALSAVGIATLLTGAAMAWAGPPAQTTGEIDLFLKMTEPSHPASGEVVTRDDLNRPPLPPPPDRLRDNVHITVGVGDPRCLPGEADWIDPWASTRRPRR